MNILDDMNIEIKQEPLDYEEWSDSKIYSFDVRINSNTNDTFRPPYQFGNSDCNHPGNFAATVNKMGIACQPVSNNINQQHEITIASDFPEQNSFISMMDELQVITDLSSVSGRPMNDNAIAMFDNLANSDFKSININQPPIVTIRNQGIQNVPSEATSQYPPNKIIDLTRDEELTVINIKDQGEPVMNETTKIESAAFRNNNEKIYIKSIVLQNELKTIRKKEMAFESQDCGDKSDLLKDSYLNVLKESLSIELVLLQDELPIVTLSQDGPVFRCSDCKESFNLRRKLDRHCLLKHQRIRTRSRVSTGSKTSNLKLNNYDQKFKLDHHCMLKRKRMKTRSTKSNKAANYLHTGSKPFKCTICGVGFAQKGNLKRHMLTKKHESRANDEQQFHCNKCEKTFLYVGNLRYHTRLVHSTPEIILESHPAKTSDGSKPFKCTICGVRFALKENLKRHMQTRKHKLRANGEHQKTFLHVESLTRNKILVHSTSEIIPESHSAKTSDVQANNLSKHQQQGIHFKQKEKLQCNLCGKKFSQKAQLSNHKLSVHDGSKTFHYSICGKSFSHKFSGHKFKKNSHEKVDKAGRLNAPEFKRKCSTQNERHLSVNELLYNKECRVVLTRDDKLIKKYENNSKKSPTSEESRRIRNHTSSERHERLVHHKTRSSKCEVCNKLIKYGNKSRHELIHRTIKPYKCKFCDRDFSDGSNLKRHVRQVHDSSKSSSVISVELNECEHSQQYTNTEESKKMTKATERDRSSVSKNSSKRHIKMHARRFQCEKCNKAFASKCRLRGHQVPCKSTIIPGKPSNEKNVHAFIKCEICGKSFSQRTNMIRHQRYIHYKIKPYKCKKCGKTFTENYKAVRHCR